MIIVPLGVPIQHKVKNKELEDLFMLNENQEFLLIPLCYQKHLYYRKQHDSNE